MRWNAYLSFKGDCEEAFTFYVRTIGGQMENLFRYAGSPFANHAPPDWGNKVMHDGITLAGQLLEGADVAPDQYHQPRGFSLTLQVSAAPEAERIFGALAEGGSVTVPLAQTFWAERFGMLIDRFGIPWMVSCEAPGSAG